MNSDALFKNLFETAPVPLIVTDHNGIIIFANQRSSAQLGYDKELLHGKYLYDLIEGGASGNILDHSTTWTFKNFVELQKSNPLFLIRKNDGALCHIELSYATSETESGLYYTWSLRDIADEKRLAHDLQERVKEQIAILRVTETLFKYPDVHAVFKDCLLHIRDGWQFPEVTAVRIKLNNGEVYTTDDFRETEWGLSAQIDGVHQQHGTLEVYYLEEVPTYAGGIFLYEEERLIGILAKLLSLFLEQWNAINKARASEALMRKITSQVPANTYQFEIEEDGSFKIHFTSKGIEQVNHPFDTEDIIINPQMIVEVIHEEDRPRFYEALAEGRRTEDFISVHYRIVVGNQVRWRWLRATPEKTESGRVLWYGSSQDITPLVDYIGTQEQILFDISHVIRRPLASLLGLCSLMKNKNLTETEVRDLAAKVLDVAGELDDFVKHLNKVYDEKKLLDEVSKFEFTFIDKRDELFNLNES